MAGEAWRVIVRVENSTLRRFCGAADITAIQVWAKAVAFLLLA